ncbi:NAD-binding protein [Paenibacillus elgii]|uniref:NAD-binding protein n=1 Tax=Paenibacillus elgii TaxID=189691 RepID=A0A2T6G508_9BACL|nr:alpha/beta fold hydrolase [Paenibacillus elgii]PUA39246.1 NAD-binding protein [Paenibacillus elgii]
MAHIFITGGTGFIGIHVLQQLVRDGHQVTALVRSKAKFEHICKQMNMPHHFDAILPKPVIGDLNLPLFGLSRPDMELVQTADVIIHAGGPMDISLNEAEARKAFLDGAEQILHFAEHIHQSKGLQHLIHVVGFKSPFTDENFLFPDPILKHLEQLPPYERMKFFADLRIRQGALQAGFPLSVIHPPIVIGSSETGDTPQTGGVGILVKSTARKLMRIVPGGASHWLPLVHVDHMAAFIAALAKESHPSSQTYYLMDDKSQTPHMTELVTMMSKELRVGGPIGSAPLSLISKALGSPLGRMLGIPKESLDFIVRGDYSLHNTRKIEQKYQLPHSVNASVIPHTIADLDFHNHHMQASADGYKRGKRGPLASLERSGTNGKNVILFLHGTLSGADCMMPLADHFREADVCLLDLPGFGRSPYHHRNDIIEGHVEAIIEAICSFDKPVTLVGHSLGGLLAAKAMKRVPERIQSLYLLQPALHPAPAKYRSSTLTEAALGFLSSSGLKKQLLAQACFESLAEIPPAYVTYVMEDLQSPRVRKTTAETLAALTRASNFTISTNSWTKDNVHILWGTKDTVYQLPKHFRSSGLTELPYAHNFPISHPKETADLLRRLGIE